MFKHAALIAGVLSVCAASSWADELYSFSFTPTQVFAGSEIQAFSFSFIVPTFVTSGQSPAFSPVTMTDGVKSTTLSTDLALNSGGISCFLFGTAVESTLGPSCSTSAVSPNGGYLFSFFSGSLPTSDGTYSTGAGDATAVFYSGGSFDETTGTLALTVSSVSSTAPEPSPTMLTASILLLAAFAARKRAVCG